MSDLTKPCPFCSPDEQRVFWESELLVAMWDGYPVSPGHALVIPKRHVASWFEATDEERTQLARAIRVARKAIEKNHDPDGYNIGINDGPAAGQTIPHLHVHVIPRYEGDTANPRGGVRGVIPEQRDYESLDETLLIPGTPDPLLPHLHLELDRSVDVDIAVAFVLPSGINHMYEHLADLLDRGGRLRLVTGDYLGATDPKALRRLLDLQATNQYTVELRAFETNEQLSFHPKSYIFRYGDETGAAFVGSSNLSNTALFSGIEWNYRVFAARDQTGFRQVCNAFEALFSHSSTVALTEDWVREYEKRRRVPVESGKPVPPPVEPVGQPVTPHEIQTEALKALHQTRLDGHTAGLVVMATGLGKTWLSAFDSEEYNRILFVAHREEILNQARNTFRKIRPNASLGLYNGQEKAPDADVLFASIQTLGKRRHLTNFDPAAFDYIVVDEFHHAAARTYRQLINYFKPKFLLGLTATPDRTDGQDLLALCQQNLVYRCDLLEGIEAGLLAKFKYFGVPDEVDYENIPWRSSHFDEEALTAAVATQKRAQNALEQYREKGGSRTIAFCCSKRHADFMREYFVAAGVKVASVHSGPESDPRTTSLERLNDGELDVLFAVDMFNEGVDLPNVDTIMMLRPTESSILWLQQFGRGLRIAENKQHLTVIDYIGNHRIFLIKPRTLLGLGPGDGEIQHALNAVQAGDVDLPAGCEVTYDLEAVEIIKQLLRPSRGTEAVEAFYKDFRTRNGIRPTASEVYHAGYNPRVMHTQYGSWHRFIATMTDLDNEQHGLTQGDTGRFLRQLEKTPMTKSYKMTLLLAMLNSDKFPGRISIDPLTTEFRRIMERNPVLRDEAGNALENSTSAKHLLEKNPIAAWVGGAGTGSKTYFEYQLGHFQTRMNVPDLSRTAYQELVRELVEWRLAEYLDRTRRDEGAADGVICKVILSGSRPILMLPDRSKHTGIPMDWQPITANDKHYEANFVKIAVNVVKNPETGDNILPMLLRGWFGPDAGRPGTSHRVVFRPDGKGRLSLEPVGISKEAEKEIWRAYSREQIPPLFGLEFNTGLWRQGFILKDKQMFLLVTLEKGQMAEEHQYEDRFESPELFQWQSQNQTSQSNKHGRAIRDHLAQGIDVHLFVRRQSKTKSRATPFTYCGKLEFIEWEGEHPITVKWRLKTPVPTAYLDALSVPS